jgi:hypothetical protein
MVSFLAIRVSDYGRDRACIGHGQIERLSARNFGRRQKQALPDA